MAKPVDYTKLHTLSEKAEKNAENYLALAKEFAGRENWGFAYSLLIFSIEELAKSKICGRYEGWITELDVAKRNSRKPEDIEIEKDKVEKMFSKHISKRTTILTQLILNLMNTFDMPYRGTVFQAIKHEDPQQNKELLELLKTFKELQNYKRDMALYIEGDGSGPEDITETDYEKMLKLAEMSYEQRNSFTAFTHWVSYDELEEKINNMLKKI